jgi:hypothetical protein
LNVDAHDERDLERAFRTIIICLFIFAAGVLVQAFLTNTELWRLRVSAKRTNAKLKEQDERLLGLETPAVKDSGSEPKKV